MSNVEFFDPPSAGPVALSDVALRLHPIDEVAICRVSLQPGTLLAGNPPVRVRTLIPSGHKIALQAVDAGQPVHRYGQIIGYATQPIAMGDHVHQHNLGMRDFDREYQVGVDVQPVHYVPEAQRRTFMGYRRSDGRVGTRNMIAVISTVNCSAHVTRAIAHHFTPERLHAYPNVDGVIALAHLAGCATRLGGDDYTQLQRTLAGMARHANVAAYIIVGLGCETNQVEDLLANYQLHGPDKPPSFTLQAEGGTRKTIQAGIDAVEALLPLVNAHVRTPEPLSELMVALQCGGSDGWSGITANPLVGRVADEIVRQGGTVVLAETPEIYGAEHMLVRRAVSHEVADRLLDKVRWWEAFAARNNLDLDNNPSVGNKAGGLTTIYEKSLGAVAKGGTTPLTGVFGYAEAVTARGFTFMDSPGYDPVSVTGQVAGGCNIILFTTGRGSCFGFKPAPSIKIATNTAMYERMQDDMDLNAGKILEGADPAAVADELLDLLIAVASGQPSKSERLGIGEDEFNPWHLGGTL